MLTKYISMNKVIEILRQRVDMSNCEQVAGELGIHKNTLYRVMSKNMPIGPKIQKALGINVYIVWVETPTYHFGYKVGKLRGAEWYEVLDEDLLFGNKPEE